MLSAAPTIRSAEDLASNQSAQSMPGKRLGFNRAPAARHGCVHRWAKRRIMKAMLILLFFGLVPFYSTAQESESATNRFHALPSEWYRLTGPPVEVICKAAYYRRASDGFLIPVQEARVMHKLTVDGIVLAVVEPERLKGQVIAFHFDLPEEWDHWYKPDVLYKGVITTGNIGLLGFRCDPGWHPASTNAPPEMPNQGGVANGSQPIRVDTNRTSPAAGSRR